MIYAAPFPAARRPPRLLAEPSQCPAIGRHVGHERLDGLGGVGAVIVDGDDDCLRPRSDLNRLRGRLSDDDINSVFGEV